MRLSGYTQGEFNSEMERLGIMASENRKIPDNYTVEVNCFIIPFFKILRARLNRLDVSEGKNRLYNAFL